jgi:poly(3-hydroxybutyrate) depolymerase
VAAIIASVFRLACVLALATLIAAFPQTPTTAGPILPTGNRAETLSTDQAESPPTRIAVKSGTVTLEAWMWRPQGTGRFPAVLVNHGSGRTPEELQRLGPYERMAETIGPVFARHGYVLLYLFRRGVGPSTQAGENAIDMMSDAAAGQRVRHLAPFQ